MIFSTNLLRKLTCEAATSATRRYLPQRKPGAHKPRFLRLAARQADGPRGMRAACGTSSGSGTCVMDATKNSQGPETRGASGRDQEKSRKRDGSLSSYRTREKRPKLDIAALAADSVSQSDASRDQSEPSDEDTSDSKMRDELMQWLAAYSTHPASLPGKGGTPFVPTNTPSRRQRPKPPRTTSTKRRGQREGNERRATKDPLPLPPNTAAKEEIEEALRSRNICFFHARGQDLSLIHI